MATLSANSGSPFAAHLTKLKIPDLWQQEAVSALKAGEDVIVHAPTGCGKTFVFELYAPSLRGQAVYTVPTRALANDKLREWQSLGWDVGITTGDLSYRPEAATVVATLEAQKTRILRDRGPALLVIDEYQMLNDEQRGRHYEIVIAMATPATQLLLLSGSVANPDEVAGWLRRAGRQVKVVQTRDRPVPLEEVDAGALQARLPRDVGGYWSRIAARAIANGYGPILFFAPRRAAAERLARSLAEALPCESPLQLTPRQANLAGDALAKLLRCRVAFHHSGISYAARAGLIEPLAKAGQLRAVVATMGLAAGVNFSMRSVLVTDTSFQAGNRQRHVAPDQLLQMFGRAGRRGLDECGYILIAPGRPRLDEARPAPVRQAGTLDWPAFLEVMQAANERGDPPFAAADRLNRTLFREHPVDLGLPAPDTVARECGLWLPTERAAFIRRSLPEMCNARGEWEPLPRALPVPLSEAWLRQDGRWKPWLHLREHAPLTQWATLGRIREQRRWWYAPEWILAHHSAEKGWRAVKPLRALCRETGQETVAKLRQARDPEAIAAVASGLLGPFPSGAVARPTTRDNRLILQLDLRECSVEAHRDRSGKGLVQPETRIITPTCCETCPEREGCLGTSPRQVPAHQWRQLGLIRPDGVPTERGRIFALFNSGEGLAVAAGLEEPAYPVEDLLFELGELRAGHRFSLTEHAGESRLAAICRATYGGAEIPGYLEAGLPPDYGSGAGHVIRTLVEEPQRAHTLTVDGLLWGDIERAQTEWRSLLRQIASAPPHPWDRWLELQAAARARTDGISAAQPLDLPELTHEQKQPMEHRLR